MPATKNPRAVAKPLRTGEGEAEGWEDFERKREWFLRSRDVASGQSRTQLRLAAIAQADVVRNAKPPVWSSMLKGTRDVAGAAKGALRLSGSKRKAQPHAESLLADPVRVTLRSDPGTVWLRLRLDSRAAKRVALESVRVFRLDPRHKQWRLVPESGCDAKRGIAWARIRRDGLYAPIGLPARQSATKLARTLIKARRDEVSGAIDVAQSPQWQLVLELARRSRVQETGWWKLGPRNINGRVKSLAIHPINRNWLLAGSANGGVWRTVNGGATWDAEWFTELSMAVGAIAFAPSNPNRVYAATGEDTPDWGPSYGGVGVYRSNNAGLTWHLCDTGPGSRSTKVLIHPTAPDTVYVAGNDGLWKSTTGGIGVGNWVRKKTGHLSDALLDPSAPDTLYVAEWKVGLFKSTDGGDNWTPCNGTAGGVSEVLPTGDAVEWPKLAMGWKGNHKTKYLVAKLGKDSGKLFYSTNGANTWLKIPGTIQPASYNEWTNMVSVSPIHSKKMLAGAVGMSRTINRFTWNPTTGTHSDHHQVVYDPVDPEICYVATDGGVYRSTNGGRDWTLRSFGMTATQFYSLGVSQSGALVLGGATQDQGIVGMKPGSDEDWFDYHAGNEGGIFVVDPNLNSNLYCTPWSHNLRRSTDGGVTWTDIRNGMTKTHDGNPTPPANVSHIAVRPNHSNTLVASGTIVVKDANGTEVYHKSFIWRSLDQGNNWMARKVTEGDATRVAFAPSDDRRCYVATSTGFFYRAKKNTFDWIQAHTDANKPADAFVTDIGVSWTNAERVYIALGGSGAKRVMRSDDGGSHWTNASGGAGAMLPSIPVNGIAVDSRDDDTIYAATDIGVFRSLDAGASWQDFNDGWAWQDVPRIIVTDIQFRRPGFTLYASTIGRGMYRRRV